MCLRERWRPLRQRSRALHPRQLEGSGIALEFAREEVVFRYESVPEFVELYSRKFGPVLMARQVLEPEGRWEALREKVPSP